jgi:hypothetical protein
MEHPLDVMLFNHVANGDINDLDEYLQAYGSHEEAINAQIRDCVQFVVRESFVEFVEDMVPTFSKNCGVDRVRIQQALIGVLEGYIDAYKDGGD